MDPKYLRLCSFAKTEKVLAPQITQQIKQMFEEIQEPVQVLFVVHIPGKLRMLQGDPATARRICHHQQRWRNVFAICSTKRAFAELLPKCLPGYESSGGSGTSYDASKTFVSH